MHITADLIHSACRKAFSSSWFKRGEDYFRRGHVQNCVAANENGCIRLEGFVQGSEPQPYSVSVLLALNKDEILIEGRCDCPIGFNCKHVAAMVLKWCDDRSLKDTPHGGVQLEWIQAASKPVRSYDEWLDQLRRAGGVASEGEATTYPSHEKNRILYLIESNDTITEPAVVITPIIVRVLKEGIFGAPKNVELERIWDTKFQYTCVRQIDVRILRKLAGKNPIEDKAFGLDRISGGEILRQILSTGRCYWRRVQPGDIPLSLGPSATGEAVWKINPSGFQKTTFSSSVPNSVILLLAPPWYLDESSRVCGVLEVGLSPDLCDAWLSAPQLSPTEAKALRAEWSTQVRMDALPSPKILEVEELKVQPVPCLKLFRSEIGFSVTMTKRCIARLEINYQGAIIPFGETKQPAEVFRGEKLVRVHRDQEAERGFYETLKKTGLKSLGQLNFWTFDQKNSDGLSFLDEDTWIGFMRTVLPKLRQSGWEVTIESDFGFNLAEPTQWYTDIEGEGTGADWFALEIGVELDGRRLNLLPLLLDYLKKNPLLLNLSAEPEQQMEKDIKINLSDGRLLVFPAERLKCILSVLTELFNPESLSENGKLKLSRLRVADVTSEIDFEKWEWMGPRELKELAQKLRSFEALKPVPPPSGLRAVLRPYQQEGLTWLQFLREYDLGGVLADDMGLGKTVQTLAHLLMEKEQGRTTKPSLVVAPTSLMTNWRQEVEQFAPGLKTLVQHGLGRKEHFDKLSDYDLVVTSYSLLTRDHEVLQKQEFHYVILDEAQYIKNPKTKYAQIVSRIQSKHRLCLTGTPMENHLGELWSLFNFLLPGFLGDERQFRSVFRTPIEHYRDEERRKLLAKRVSPFILRRKKEQVAKELPEKTEIEQRVELSSEQRDLYETIRLAMDAKIREEIAKRGLARSQIVILDALLKLRQVCCDPRLVKLERARKVKSSTKLELLMDLVPEMVSEGRKILLFSQFTSMLDLIQKELEAKDIPYVRLTGETTDRATPIRQFQNGKVPVFLISLKAGGTGLNLTAADTVIHYDPWWNPAVENQATDRAHRIGQDKRVFVYKLITAGTVEEKILELQKRKQTLVEGLLGGGGSQGLQLSQEDLNVLFAPLE